MRWFKKYVHWRRRVEMKRRFPDPFLVCGRARECAHVDGMWCKPKECKERTDP